MAVLLRRFLKHWYFLVQDEQRQQAAALVTQALEHLRQRRPLPLPAVRRAAEEELLRRLPNASPEERQHLLHLFERWGLLDNRLARLRSGPPRQQAHSALVLGRMQVREALSDICRLLETQDPELRLAALRALELIGDPKALDPLIRILPAVKDTAWRLVWAALISCARPQPERLLPHLSHSEPRVRMVVAAVLGEVGTPALVEKLLPAAADFNPEVRARAVWALGRLGSPQALPVLIERLQDPVWFVRLQAAGALGALPDRRAHEPLALAVRDPNLLVRQKAASALYALWRDPIYLLDLLRQGAPERYALEALISELEWRGVTWEAISRVNSPLPMAREQSRELVKRLIRVGAYAPVLYAIEMHPDTEVRMALLDLVVQNLPPEGHLSLVEVLGSPHLDPRTRRAIEKVVGLAAEVPDELA